MASISSRTAALHDKSNANELRRLLNDARLDLVNLKAQIAGITAKLDADGGVTDTNYGALWGAANTTLHPLLTTE
jgi:hypothetical protein